MGKLFKITGYFEQYHKTVDPGFVMEISIDDNCETFTGVCKELYEDERLTKENSLRYITGKIFDWGKNGVGDMAFYKLSQDPYQSALFYKLRRVDLDPFIPVSDQTVSGQWGVVHDRIAESHGIAGVKIEKITSRQLGALSYHCVADHEDNRFCLDDVRFGDFKALTQIAASIRGLVPSVPLLNGCVWYRDSWDEIVFKVLDNNPKSGLGKIDRDELHTRINRLPFLGLFIGEDLIDTNISEVAEALFVKLPVGGERRWQLKQFFMSEVDFDFLLEATWGLVDVVEVTLNKLRRCREVALTLKAFYYTEQLTPDEKVFLTSRPKEHYFNQVLAVLAK